MYRSRRGQQSFLDDIQSFGGVALDPDNEWVKLAEAIPWDEFETDYAASFSGAAIGNPAKPARMALGTLLIKRHYHFSNEDTVKEVQMNPYLQFFIGLVEFSHKAPYDARSISNFKKRVTTAMMLKLDDYIAEVKHQKSAERAAPKRLRAAPATKINRQTEEQTKNKQQQLEIT